MRKIGGNDTANKFDFTKLKPTDDGTIFLIGILSNKSFYQKINNQYELKYNIYEDIMDAQIRGDEMAKSIVPIKSVQVFHRVDEKHRILDFIKRYEKFYATKYAGSYYKNGSC